MEYSFRFEVKVPAAIFEPKVGVIRACRGKGLMDGVYFGLKGMPEWYVPCQCIMLKKHDEKALERKTEELFKKLKVK